MIKTFRDDCTRDIFDGRSTRLARRVPKMLHRKACLMMDHLNAVVDVQTMATPPGNRLHKLSGNLAGFWSISINDQWRIIFRFQDGHAYDVQITDYH